MRSGAGWGDTYMRALHFWFSFGVLHAAGESSLRRVFGCRRGVKRPS